MSRTDAKRRKEAVRSEVRYPDFDQKSLKRSFFWARPTAESLAVILRMVSRLQVTGTERITDGALIIAPYHGSALDPIAVGVAIWRQGVLPHFLAKSSLFKGLMGRGLVKVGQIPVLRASTKAGDSLIHAKRALDAGQKVVIYPQGTLTKDPELWPQPAKTGAARLSLETGTPVVPMAHWGLQRILPVGGRKLTPRPRDFVRAHFGEPILPPPVEGSPSGSLTRAFADRITAGIAQELAILRGEELPQRFRDTIEQWDDAHTGSADGTMGDYADGTVRDDNPADDEETR